MDKETKAAKMRIRSKLIMMIKNGKIKVVSLCEPLRQFVVFTESRKIMRPLGRVLVLDRDAYQRRVGTYPEDQPQSLSWDEAISYGIASLAVMFATDDVS